MVDSQHSKTESLVGFWTVLFPATYAVHIAEEFWGGFTEFTAKLGWLVLSDTEFLIGNALFFVSMCIGLIWARSRPSGGLFIVVLGVVVIVNVMLHIGGSLLSMDYSPGLISGLLLWLPLGIIALERSHRTLPISSFRVGVLLGLIAHAVVPVVGLGVAKAV